MLLQPEFRGPTRPFQRRAQSACHRGPGVPGRRFGFFVSPVHRPIGRPWGAPGRPALLALRLLSGLLLGALLVLPGTLPAVAAPRGAADARVQPPKPPFGVAVMPFRALRTPPRSAWLGAFLQERIARALLRSGQVAVVGLDTAAQWQRKLGLHMDSPVSAAHLDAMGVKALVQGTTQEVLGLVEIDLRVRSAGGDLLRGKASHLRVLLHDEPPGPALQRVLDSVGGALLPRRALSELHPPADWDAVRTLYTLLAQPIVPGDRGARPALVARLRPLAADPGLSGRVHQALAELLMEQARLYLPTGAGRDLMLQDALQQATLAVQADPSDPHRLALRGELRVFLKQYYESKSDASVARLRNPLEGLAYVVLGLVAGLSTGEATVHLKRALAVAPYLRTDQRPQGSPPYQGGILEPLFRRWQTLRANHGLARPDNYQRLIRRATDAFNNQQWDEAERLFQQASERDDADFTPWLYLNRMLIELGHPERAVSGLQQLATDNPHEPEILYWLATAEARSGSPAAAQRNYKDVLADHPNDVRAQYGLATTAMALGHWHEALGALHGVLQAHPERAEVWKRLGIVQGHLGDWDAARSALQHALELDPDNSDIRTRLDQARHELAKERGGSGSAPAGRAAATAPAAGKQGSGAQSPTKTPSKLPQK